MPVSFMAKVVGMSDAARAKSAELEYVNDVPYPRRFIPQIAPPQLRLVAAMNGIAPPPEDDFDYCELGCGNGDTLTLLAASNPDARFVGVDFNREHVACARSLAERGRLTNVKVLPASFEDLLNEDLPNFDFVVAHGVLSWVGPETMDAVLAFARQKLKPGGLLYVSYNALPGWAAVEPLRKLMVDHTAGFRGSSLERAREGLAFAQRLADAGVAYFVNHPTAKSMLALMRTAGLPYVVHEYFNTHQRSFYFAEIAEKMKANGLGFVGQLPLHLNVPELAIPPSVKKMSEGITNRIELETLKDFATNELFRSEIYVRGSPQRSVAEMRAYFEGTPFGVSSAQIKREVRLPLVTLEFKGPVYDPILAELVQGPATAMELAQREKCVAIGQTRIGDCLRNLVLGGQVVPMRAELGGAPANGHVKLRSPFNEVALDEALGGDGPLAVASPVMGTGLHVSLLEAIGLRLMCSVEPAARDAWLRDYARKQEMPIKIGDRKIKDEGELARVMAKELERMDAAIPKLGELGVVG